MNSATLQTRANAVDWWHSGIDLGHDVVTRGRSFPMTNLLPYLNLPDDLTGMSVIDICTWDGYMAFECERRGAARVVATDSFAWDKRNAELTKHRTGSDGFDIAHEARDSNVIPVWCDVLDLDKAKLGTFDIVLFLGVLYHMRHPLLALERVASLVTNSGVLIVESYVDMLDVSVPAMRFYPGNEINADETNWWGPNAACIEAMLRNVGFPYVSLLTTKRRAHCRPCEAHMNIVIANGPARLDNGQEVILFPSRWDSGVHGKKPFEFYPYELAYLSTLLKRELPDANVTMLDGNVEGWNGDQYIQEIAKLEPDVLVCECSALTYPTMTRVMQAVKDALPYSLIAILCGPMAQYAHVYKDLWTYAPTGEYELKVLEMLGGTVPQHAYTDAGLINLDWLPWPEDEDIDRRRYYEINHYAPRSMIQVYPTRGCPLSCTFCVVPTYYGGHGKTSRSHRGRDVIDVCDEIEYLAEKYADFRGCYFNEEAHNANTEWFVSFCEELIRRGLNEYQYDAMCGMWPFTLELVQLAKAAGYRQIRFGMESTSEQVGRAIKKTIHKEKTETFLGWLKANGIGAYCTIQVGAMGSTEESDLATIRDVKEWIRRGMIQKWQLSTSTPQPSTPFYELAQNNQWLTTDDINEYDGMRAVVDYPTYPASRIQAVRNGAGL